MAARRTGSSSKTIISKVTGKPVDARRSRAAIVAARTRKQNALASIQVHALRLHHKLIATGLIMAVLLLTVIGIHSQIEAFASSSPIAAFTGLDNKCLDNRHSVLENHNPVQLYHCNGTNAQRWTLSSDGAIHNVGGSGSYCLDIPNQNKAPETYLQLYSCNGTIAQQFSLSGNTIVSLLTGYCVTVSHADSADSTRLWMIPCDATPSQQWVYQASLNVQGSRPAFSNAAVVIHSADVSTIGDAGGSGVTATGAHVKAYASLGGSDLSAHINAAGVGTYVSLPAGTYSFRDFSHGIQGRSGTTAQGLGAYGLQLSGSSAGILGAGSRVTTIEMQPHTSTKAAYVPPEAPTGLANARTNQLQYILVSNAASYTVDGIKVLGTDQGHLYNGLMFNGIRNLSVSNTTVADVPGNASGPPGETFEMNLYNQPAGGQANFTNVTTDGGKIAAVGIGLNSIHGTITMRNVLTKNTGYSAGIAGWQMAGTDNYYHWVSQNNIRNYNAERHSGTTNFYDPVWSQPTSGHFDINYTWEPGWVGGSINFYFSNQQAWQTFIQNRNIKKITIVTNPHGQGNIRATVHVFIGGQQQPQGNYVQFYGSAS